MHKQTQDEPQLGHGGAAAGFEMRVFEVGGRRLRGSFRLRRRLRRTRHRGTEGIVLRGES
jgi:hypothetical protein